MPRYDYQCQSCNETFEVTQGFHDEPLTHCIHCDGTVKKLISAAGFMLKGEGWYVTDNPSSSRKKGMDAEKKSVAEPSCTPQKKGCEGCPSASAS